MIEMGRVSLSSLNGSVYFTSGMPDVTIPGTDGTSQQVTVTCGGEQLLSESMWPVGGVITLSELGDLLEPYARKSLVCSMTITAAGASATVTVLFAKVDVGVSAAEFYTNNFLTTLQGTKVTALGRREVLWFYGSGSASVSAKYDDGTTRSFTASVIGSSLTYTCIDVSPSNFAAQGKQLVAYTVTVGSRTQKFEIDFSKPDCAPILEFYNSFGVWELIYCTGTHKVSPEYKRSSARIGGMLRSYKIEETRLFKADTGVLTTAMANWAEDLFRSDEVYVVNVINGSVVNADGGKEVMITESKSDITNDHDFIPRFTFSYQYAQHIQNVMQMNRVGRIFDNTFDHTFN